jgi:uridine kinase
MAAKILSLSQLKAQKFKFLENLEEAFSASLGAVTYNFIMIVWGMSGNGKSNFLMKLVKQLCVYGKVLYISLEEGFSVTTQLNVFRNLGEQFIGDIQFADHTMTLDALEKLLKKRTSPQFVIIDSVQYMSINYNDYKALKERFTDKAFIFISHANGKLPDGKTADKIRYDSDIKIRVEGFIAFVQSRFGGNKPFLIWEQGAKNYYKKDFKSKIEGKK